MKDRLKKEDYVVSRISYKEAMGVIVEKHYLHRKCPCTLAFGLFNENGGLLGVIVYGVPSSSTLRKGIAGTENANNVIELTRLWVDDSVPKNGESFLIGNTLPFVNREIIVSYAEPDQGHIGIIYQATNWIYTGLSAKRTNWTVEGITMHSQTIADKYKTAKNIREVFGDKFSLQPRPRKHRYIFLKGNKKRRNELKGMLKYPILEYPKNIGK